MVFIWNDYTKNKMDLYELFKLIKKRPGMFLGHISIKNLYIFLQGYYFARRDLKVVATEQDTEFNGFQDWIQEKYDVKTCHSWASIILLNSEDDKATFWKFFDLLEEYKQFVGSKNAN